MNTLKQFPYQNVLVLGLAKSGEAAAKILREHDLHVIVNDKKDLQQDGQVKELQALGIEVVTGSHPISLLETVDIVVKNPGIPYDNPMIEEAIKRNIPIITEVELAYQLSEGPIIGITGSNGKTTTTTLIYEMLKQSGKKASIAGNIGMVASEVARHVQEDETLVMELSSFQLLGVQTFRPRVSVLLNIYEAHLDYHKTMEHYAEAKANICKNQRDEDYVIYNADDPIIEKLIMESPAQKIPFSTKEIYKEGAWSDGEKVYFQDQEIMLKEEIVLVGEHNFENILAAISAASIMGATPDGIKRVLTTFQGVPHRLQFIKNVHGRLFYNNSKATNILATTTALNSFQQPIILLAGGLDRGNSFDGLIPYLSNVKAMVLFGQTKEKLKDTGLKAGIENIYIVDNVEQAVNKAYEFSAENDVILLSPACASWDQYRSFEERGDMFVKAVHKL